MRTREIKAKYEDPLDLIWIHAASRCGMRVVRDAEVFAAWDGVDTLRIGRPETLDPDDSLAQMIFHEMCHALVAGPTAFDQPDWGLEFGQPDHEVHEHACLRLQAALATEFHLREFLAATTDYRKYYDELPTDPLTDDDTDPAVELAKLAFARAKSGPWARWINEALQKTQAISAIVADAANSESLWSKTQANGIQSPFTGANSN